MATSDPIETPRLRIESFPDAFLTERYVGWLNDPQVTRYSEQRHRRHTLESCRDYLHSFDGTPNHFWAIVSRDHALGHIGNINAYVDEHHSVADVGIMIGEHRAQGQGLATEAWLGVCDFLLRVSNIRKVTAGTSTLNEPMVRLMKKTGMTDDGRRIRQQLFEDQEADVVHSAFFRDAWLQKHPNGPFVE